MKLTGKFDTRREAEMTVERLVQQFDLDRSAILIAADGDANTAGVEEAGSDDRSASPTPEARDDAELNGKVVVSVEVGDHAAATEVKAAFAEFDASEEQAQ